MAYDIPAEEFDTELLELVQSVGVARQELWTDPEASLNEIEHALNIVLEMRRICRKAMGIHDEWIQQRYDAFDNELALPAPAYEEEAEQ